MNTLIEARHRIASEHHETTVPEGKIIVGWFWETFAGQRCEYSTREEMWNDPFSKQSGRGGPMYQDVESEVAAKRDVLDHKVYDAIVKRLEAGEPVTKTERRWYQRYRKRQSH